MPTCNRREFISAAIKCYQSQTWEDKELVVVDDGSDSIADLVVNVAGVRYFRTEKFKTLGEKVNFCCEQAKGEIIVTWDDDDWYAPERIADQVIRLMASQKSLTGYNTMLFFDGLRTSQYRGDVDYAVGNSQVYRKEFWRNNQFEAVNVGYDTTFSSKAKQRKEIVCVPGEGMAVARIHTKNISGPRGAIGDASLWPWVSLEALPEGFCRA